MQEDGRSPSSQPHPDGRRKRWLGQRQARREEFVAGAMTAVRRHGESTGLDEIAAQTGVSKSVVYRHFTDRADLFAAMLDAIADEVLMPRIAAELGRLGEPGGGDVTDADTIRRVVRAFVSVVDDEPELYRFALAHAAVGAGGDFVASTERRIALALSALVGDRLRELGLDSGGAQVWAFGVVGMVQLATRRWADERSMSADALVDYLTTIVLGGLTALAQSPRAG
jgi:AcrR family transcriptional regulator